MDFTKCTLSQLTQDLEIPDARAANEAVLWAHMLDSKVSRRAGRASSQGRCGHGEVVMPHLLARICGCSVSF